MIAGLDVIIPRPALPPIATREELIDALFLAAEIEHAIMCQYLYAAFSIDRSADAALSPEHTELARSFTITMLKIARQEMAHLGIVQNLLISVGAAPDFDRPNMPIQRDYYSIDHRFMLLPFGDEMLALAAELEAPIATRAERLPYYPSVAAIYERIEDGLEALASLPDLFIGGDDPQISNEDFGALPTQVWYDVCLLPVTDLASALAAIAEIRKQGEGTTLDDPSCHYGMVLRARAQWDALDASVRAAMIKPVPTNPLTRQRGDIDPTVTCVVLSDPRAVALAKLANRAYELALLLLARLYGANDGTTEDRAMYLKYAFFPLMTIVLRPVGEILTELPAGDGTHAATCTFELDGPIRTFPERRAFHIQLVERLTHLATGLAEVAKQPGVPARLAFVAQNVAYVQARVQAYLAEHP